MTRHIENRLHILEELRAELFGPLSSLQRASQLGLPISPPQTGTTIDCSQEISFAKNDEAYGPFLQKGSEQEILLRDPPSKRYGVGVLYPYDSRPAIESPPTSGPRDDNQPQGVVDSALTKDAAKSLQSLAQRVAAQGRAEEEDDDFDISGANDYRPSCLGISFLAKLDRKSEVVITLTGAWYKQKLVTVEGRRRQWWLRTPVELEFTFKIAELDAQRRRKLTQVRRLEENECALRLEGQLFCRPTSQADEYLVTASVVNRSTTGNGFSYNETCLFQTFFKACVRSGGVKGKILPYPSVPASEMDDEERSLSLLYRNNRTFAVGHGCAANWSKVDLDGLVDGVYADCLPVCELPSTTPDLVREVDNKAIVVGMKALAGLDPALNGFGQLQAVVDEYEKWIFRQEGRIDSLSSEHQGTARRHLDECRICLSRMGEGLEFLKQDSQALEAFRLANHAVLLQQVQASKKLRVAKLNESSRVFFSTPYQEPDLDNLPSYLGQWRAFQIGFLLMNLKGAKSSYSTDRNIVELIWFPTGGGKTEAYLGLAAYTIILRRLQDGSDKGVEVLMRYTLRLLTAQQFQRASSLICALELLRRTRKSALGEGEISIGIWLGSATSPNSRSQAKRQLRGLNQLESEENPFILRKCPWCGAQMGPLESGPKRKNKKSTAGRVLGYTEDCGTVLLHCPDSACDFHDSLPVYVIDEDIYEQKPTLVIGTVDKFAALAWKPEARALFGVARSGERTNSPPGLIIQDELHLISGPLGSMVGLYESLIEELCTDRRGGIPVKPKIVSSTATIRNYQEQIRGLYGRESVQLFPPPGLDASDSFFAKQVDDEPGRLYVGVNAPGLGSMQTTQVRSFTALLQASQIFKGEERDPWWTLLVFFNSLRELGTTVSLFQSDIPDYFQTFRYRTGREPAETRRLSRIKELTGRLRSDEVPRAIEELEITPHGESGKKAVDVCLASNIIEVGIDVTRLSLMVVVGQPKTTAQYIQVTGRVGRKWKERPGLVVTLYGASKPRDRSHFEKFRSYHETLYAQVEPTSVTPFSRPALLRALHAVLVGYVRQLSEPSEADCPYPYPANSLARFGDLLRERVRIVDDAAIADFEEIFDQRTSEWLEGKRSKWQAGPRDSDPALLRELGAYATSEERILSWGTPRSMRNVDAECQVEITNLYARENRENA